MPDLDDQYMEPPPEFARAPEWALAAWRQTRRDQHRTSGELMRLQGEIRDMKKKLGSEPDSDGHGGKGLIGDVRSLVALRSYGIGFIAAIGLTGAILIFGIVHWIQSIVGAK